MFEQQGVERKEAIVKPKKNTIQEHASWHQYLFTIKRDYLNGDNPKMFMEYFWKKFDPSRASLWKIDYIIDEDQGKIDFITWNLLMGLINRWDSLSNDTFGVMGVYGKKGNFHIRGVLLWPGKHVHPLCEHEHTF